MIHHAAWQDAAWPDTVDCIITDPPYSARTHEGHNNAVRDGSAFECRSAILYNHLTPAMCNEWAAVWAPRVRYWVAVMCDHVLIPAWQDAFQAAGLYSRFPPVPCVMQGMTMRIAAEGPSSWAVYLVVARTARPAMDSFGRMNDKGKPVRGWGALPGAYVVSPGDRSDSRIGGKPLPLMRQIIRDYSRPGMVVADPCCGYGTTLIAAAEQGRNVWGCDTDAESVKRTRERLETVKAQPQLFEAATQLEIA